MASALVIAGRLSSTGSRMIRQSVKREFFSKMDARVKPAHDG
jgi:hypothetical protein